MDEPELTAQEQRHLNDLRNLPTSVRSRVIGWTLELSLSIGLFSFGLLAERRSFLILGFVSLLYFAVWRMYVQFRGFRLLHNIYNKQFTQTPEQDAS